MFAGIHIFGSLAASTARSTDLRPAVQDDDRFLWFNFSRQQNLEGLNLGVDEVHERQHTRLLVIAAPSATVEVWNEALGTLRLMLTPCEYADECSEDCATIYHKVAATLRERRVRISGAGVSSTPYGLRQ